MYSLKEFFDVVSGIAPIELSYKMIGNGAYDNSGIIVDNGEFVSGVLFSLDLSMAAVECAKEFGANTIVTHHPAIYQPIKNLSVNGETAALLEAIKLGMNVVSMHLNLDIADSGIDQCLAEGLGAKNARIIDIIDGNNGYGREFSVDNTAEDMKNAAIKVFGSDKIMLYGGGNVYKAASFCGAGSSDALSAIKSGKTDADLIITSDVPHHVIKEFIENGKSVLVIPHYVAEQYGFKKFYQKVLEKIQGKTKAYYFEDKRFM